MIQAVELREPLDFSQLRPSLQISKNDDATAREIENEQFRICYRAKIDSFVKRKDTYQSNVGNAYELTSGQCSKVMQSKLQAMTDFNSKIKSNPIELLNTILEHSCIFKLGEPEVNRGRGLLDYTG